MIKYMLRVSTSGVPLFLLQLFSKRGKRLPLEVNNYVTPVHY